MFDVLFLGTGTAFSRFEDNYHNNAVVFTSAGPVLLDCGTTAPQALHEQGIRPWDLVGVIITHLHGDHCGGLEQLVWERYYTGLAGPGFLRTPIHAHPAVVQLLEGYLRPVLSPYTSSDGTLETAWDDQLVELCGVESFWVGNTAFTLAHTPHVGDSPADKPACSVVISGPNHSTAFYSGDTTFRKGLVSAIARTTHTVFHECSFMPRYDGTVHTHYEELLQLEPDVRARTVLMHYGVVPTGIDPVADGFRAAAQRGQRFSVAAP